MRVLHLADRASARGGADWHLLSVLAELSRDHEVTLAAGRTDGTARLPCPLVVVPGLDARAAAPADVDGVVRAFDPDVIHLHNVMNPSVLEWAGQHRAVVTVQDHRVFCPGRGKWTAGGEICTSSFDKTTCAPCFDDDAYFDRIHALTRARLDALRALEIVVLSEYMAGELAAAGLARRRIHVIPPFVHGLDPSAGPDGPPCVLFVGRLVEPKGVLDALAAWRAAGIDLPFVAAGTGKLRAPLEAAGCEVLGWVPHDGLSAVYRRGAVVVMPSRWQEPFGIVGLEALSLGVPVAAWDSGGVREWHPGPGLVPWGDVTALAGAIRSLAGKIAPPPRAGFGRPERMGELVRLYESL